VLPIGGSAPPAGGGRQVVKERDAEALATALQRVVNGKKADHDTLDLPMIVGLVNFLRGGVFEIL
jgi:hypothetical protein